MLRLEYLFDRFNHFARSDDAELHHNALITLFELADISARGDIKALLLKEFDRQKFGLNSLKSSKEVDQDKLLATLSELEHAASQINSSVIKPNAIIADNEWLNAIRTRLHTPGGTSPIDLPGFYAWRHSPVTSRRELLQKFIYPMLACKSLVIYFCAYCVSLEKVERYLRIKVPSSRHLPVKFIN
jgi:cell division protein ZapD